jgi:hypothetical protein
MLTATRRAPSAVRTFACTSSAGVKGLAQAAGQYGCDFSCVTDRIAVAYRLRMFTPKGFIEPCLPSLASTPPAGPDWDHEIKHDGYRLIVRRDGATVRLFTRGGYEWTGRFPAITDAAGELRARTFTLDGEAVVCGADGIAVFDALHGQRRLREAFLYEFDLIEMDGEDLRHWPFSEARRVWSGCWPAGTPASCSTSTSWKKGAAPGAIGRIEPLGHDGRLPVVFTSPLCMNKCTYRLLFLLLILWSCGRRLFAPSTTPQGGGKCGLTARSAGVGLALPDRQVWPRRTAGV